MKPQPEIARTNGTGPHVERTPDSAGHRWRMHLSIAQDCPDLQLSTTQGRPAEVWWHHTTRRT